MIPRIKPKALVVGFSLILVVAATAKAKGWRGIVPLHSTRSEVEKLLGPPTEETTSSAVYVTPNETVVIYFANGHPCGIGAKYSPWRVAGNTVTKIFITPNPGSPLSQLSIDESRYKKFRAGHLSETRYIDDLEGEAVTVVGNEVRSIDYFAAAEDSHLECPGVRQTNPTNCEYLPDAFDSLGDIDFKQGKLLLDNFSVALLDKKAIAYIVAYGGTRARPGEAIKCANHAKQYLINVRHFPDDRINVIDGGYREKRELTLYVASEGVCPPIPTPTIDPRDVQIITGGREKRIVLHLDRDQAR
jgi:hypothetical protein